MKTGPGKNKAPVKQAGIIRDASDVRRLFWITGGCVLASILFIVLLNTRPFDRRPAWAPPGCTVTRQTEGYPGPRLIIIVNNFSNFDTEAECAAVIISARESEENLLSDPVHNMVQADIEIHFPPEDNNIRPILQYVQVRTPVRNFDTLRFIRNRITVYENNEIRIPDLRAVADGSTRLGFLPETWY